MMFCYLGVIKDGGCKDIDFVLLVVLSEFLGVV